MKKIKSRKLTIAIFHLAFIYSGGGEKLVLKEADELKKLGHKIKIFTTVLDEKKCFPDIIKKYNISTFLPQFLFKRFESFRVILSCLIAPFIAFKFRKYDLIFAANQPSSWIAYWVKFIGKVPYVSYLAQPTRFLYPRKIDKEMGLYFVKKESVSLSVKLMKIFKRFIFWADSISIKSSDSVLVNGEYMKTRIEKTYKIKAISCPSGTTCIDKAVSLSRKLKKPYLLITNRHFSQKRFEYGIIAFSTVKNVIDNLELIIIGAQTEYTKEIKVLVSRLGLLKRVNFLGYVKEKDLENLYSNALAYLYTAPEEDFGMGIIESMGAGTPVIAWDNAGPSQTVVNGKTGYLACYCDAADYNSKLYKLLTARSKLSNMSKNALDYTKKKYSWKNHLNILENTFYSVIKR